MIYGILLFIIFCPCFTFSYTICTVKIEERLNDISRTSGNNADKDSNAALIIILILPTANTTISVFLSTVYPNPELSPNKTLGSLVGLTKGYKIVFKA